METFITWFQIYGSIFSKYLFLAGFFFLIFYIFFKQKLSLARIQKRFPKQKDYIREISYSMFSVAVFTSVVLLIFKTPFGEYTQVYKGIDEFGTPYFWMSMILMTLVHDTYFYWTHRILHHPRLFKLAHLVHHKSHNPSPWAAYSFHPLEAIIEAGVLIVIVMIIPTHRLAFVLYFLFSVAFNIVGHLGYEIFPKGINKHWLGKWINTSTNHNMHHQYSSGNYGFYFTFWDKLMGTTHKNYHKEFEEIKDRKKEENIQEIEMVT